MIIQEILTTIPFALTEKANRLSNEGFACFSRAYKGMITPSENQTGNYHYHSFQ